MAHTIINLGQGFWNIRGALRIGGLIDVGTHCSLVQLAKDRFIFLDSYELSGAVREQVMALTCQGQAVEAILNLHPFHTLHCEAMARDFPQATLYGSLRHQQKLPQLPWSPDRVESAAVVARYPELEFSLTQGLDYISAKPGVHAGSLLAYHPASKSLHVDDTFAAPPQGGLLEKFLPEIFISPATRWALKPEANAAETYCEWVQQLADQWQDTQNFCAAHSDLVRFKAGEFKPALLTALERARPKLQAAQ